jgi:hypothetical protein
MLIMLHSSLYIVYLLLLCLFIKGSRFFIDEHLKVRDITAFFLIKVIAGILLTLLYTYYYTDQSKSDIYRYFNDSKVISQLLFTEPKAWISAITGFELHNPEMFKHITDTQYFSHPENDIATDNSLIIRISSLFNFLSAYNIYINTLFFSFLSFSGCFMLYRFFKKFLSYKPEVLVIPFFLLPSLVFWSSGALKESLLYFSIGLLVYPLHKPYSFKCFAMQLLALGILWNIKVHIVVFALSSAAVALPFLIQNSRVKIFTIAVIALLFTFGAYWATENKICETLIDKRNEFSELAIKENAGSSSDVQMLSGNCETVFEQIPKALTNSILRPFVWSSRNIFELGFALENLVLLTVLFYSLKFRTKPSASSIAIAVSCFTFALINYLIIGVTVPIMGAVVHYRVIATPFLITGFIIIFNLNFSIYIRKED